MGAFQRIYRSTYTQAHIIGFICFTQPGLWTSIMNTGAGGLQTVTTSNVANSLLFAIMFVLSPVYAILVNKIGIKPVIIIGTVGYVFWSAGLYQNSKDGTQWLVLFGAATCGISAAALWTGEATVAILYPEDSQRGKFIGTWQLWNKLGGVISGSITLALNYKTEKSGGISLNTYIVLIALQCLGFPASFLLSPPEKLIRKNGKKLKTNITKETWKQRCISLKKVFLKKEVLCLLPLFMSNVWFLTWQSNYVTHHFTVRVRALNSLLTAVVNGATDVIAGYLLDVKMRKSLKVKISWLVTVLLMVGFFIYSIIIQHEFDVTPEEGIDWSGNPRYARSYIPFQIFKMSGELVFNWVYWVIGAYHFHHSEIAYVSGIIRSFESLGQCLSFVIGSVNDSDMVNLSVAAGAFFISIPSVTYLTFQADDEEASQKLDFEEEDEESLKDEEEVGSTRLLDNKENSVANVRTRSRSLSD